MRKDTAGDGATPARWWGRRATDRAPGALPADTLARATGRGVWFRSRPALSTVLGAGLIVLLLLPFSNINPSPLFGLPGALAMAVALAVAVIVGPYPGAIVAVVGGFFFYFAVADPDLPFRRDATALTVVVWIVLALAAGLVAERLRRRLVGAFAEIADREAAIAVELTRRQAAQDEAETAQQKAEAAQDKAEAAQDEAEAAQHEAAMLHERLEKNLLPRVAVTDQRLHVAHRYVPGETRMAIGGDFMGTAELSDGTLALAIGDVSGHGPDAAALGATLRASWRALALTGMAPLDLVQRLDGILRGDVADSEAHATLCCAWVNPARDRLTLVLAGHHRPLVLTGGAAREPEAPYGPPLGLLEDWMRAADPPWQVADFDLAPGWTLLLYTDGLVEGHAAPAGDERFGAARLAPLLHGVGAAACFDARALDDLLEQVQAANGKPFGDDVALLVVCHAGADRGDS